MVLKLRAVDLSLCLFFFFFSSRRRHTRCSRDWSSDVCSSDLTLSRRTFLRAGAAAGGGLLVSFSLPARIGTALAAGPQAARDFKPNGFIRIDRDGGVTLVMHKVEMGQGTYTSMRSEEHTSELQS